MHACTSGSSWNNWGVTVLRWSHSWDSVTASPFHGHWGKSDLWFGWTDLFYFTMEQMRTAHTSNYGISFGTWQRTEGTFIFLVGCKIKRECVHRIIEQYGLKGASRGRLVQPPCNEQGHPQLDQVAQSPIQPDLECSQGWDIYHLSVQSVSVPHHPHCKKYVPCS